MIIKNGQFRGNFIKTSGTLAIGSLLLWQYRKNIPGRQPTAPSTTVIIF
jgi:hypothetical protein